MDRKHFLTSFAGVGLVATGFPILPFRRFVHLDGPMDRKKVRTFVRVAHRDMDKVKQMLADEPNLINVAWDWKGGDFETALDAACHVGYKELAQFLIEKGAQPNLFTACLFGKIEVVQPFIEAFPQAINARGPHGFTLLHHAERGGEEALEVKVFLESLGARETQLPLNFS
ncbi:MAG: ankyrin repeat domain-containing protein [Bacteroidota bacterium]